MVIVILSNKARQIRKSGFGHTLAAAEADAARKALRYFEPGTVLVLTKTVDHIDK